MAVYKPLIDKPSFIFLGGILFIFTGGENNILRKVAEFSSKCFALSWDLKLSDLEIFKFSGQLYSEKKRHNWSAAHINGQLKRGHPSYLGFKKKWNHCRSAPWELHIRHILNFHNVVDVSMPYHTFLPALYTDSMISHFALLYITLMSAFHLYTAYHINIIISIHSTCNRFIYIQHPTHPELFPGASTRSSVFNSAMAPGPSKMRPTMEVWLDF